MQRIFSITLPAQTWPLLKISTRLPCKLLLISIIALCCKSVAIPRNYPTVQVWSASFDLLNWWHIVTMQLAHIPNIYRGVIYRDRVNNDQHSNTQSLRERCDCDFTMHKLLWTLNTERLGMRFYLPIRVSWRGNALIPQTLFTLLPWNTSAERCLYFRRKSAIICGIHIIDSTESSIIDSHSHHPSTRLCPALTRTPGPPT